MSFSSDSDLSGTIARLFIYPVKSCGGIEVQEAVLTETGLELDRAWMVVDAKGMFLTQRELPRMALIHPQIKGADIVLRAPGSDVQGRRLPRDVEIPIAFGPDGRDRETSCEQAP